MKEKPKPFNNKTCFLKTHLNSKRNKIFMITRHHSFVNPKKELQLPKVQTL